MSIFDVIFSFTNQMPEIMRGVQRVVIIIAFFIFTYSGKVLLTAQSNEKGVRASAWFGLFFAPMLVGIENWMNILTTSAYGQNLGPIFELGNDFTNTEDALMIFNAVEIYVIAFGWFGVIGGTFKIIEAPKHNNPGMKRKAIAAAAIGVACANIAFTIDIVGKTFGKDDAYKEIRKELTN